ncbi:NAD(P)-dependent dehydrogenase (short-subunit alcohol dehydrogenase family)/pimeloyl-ACP methyl ester carboxylesterase [Mycobacterium frederiksbergense]|uniref:NAD(P)-dependent dehydrogenase (Short-subunit alcohol dehydrogenase family)/pimeloyl-ACP methyl ester carboxylesterase n=1 Tax=Mycolicibacterium frederiksbergense TaxID=117567 RepID=A0ABT6KYE5_9MYCO|nr:SDR family oxidoreductase [Mycolicibacterium frederiksbergense]MDH6195017.1 NAD(P)-dependent dehydrogenase (short-subunit alcohol dehydrogenase family)/pimeloyl-ACP methyl ester carboxylesterase [Mycolicibacterium frederiksbergense]
MQRFVVSSDGTRIAVYEQGDPQRPTLVMAHGWPDSHVLWNGVTGELEDRFHIVRYDNRGAGASDVPKPVAAYRMERFADDLAAVIEDVSPGRRVHVLAHDWGSVGVWEYLSRPEASARVASFTSVSGPSSDHYGAFLRDRLARPYRPVRFAKAVNLASRFSYWIPFSIPVIAPALMRAGAARRLQAIDTPGPKFQSETLDTDAANSLKIYRANAFRSIAKVRRDHYVSVPVQLICNDHDPVVRGHGYDDESKWVPLLWRRDLKAGHWAPFSHWRAIAAATAELIEHIEGAPAARALRRAQVGRPRETFTDTLVSVTGAGSGIGRATALAFAAQGAELLVSDIDKDAAAATTAEIVEQGGLAHAYGLDVSDADAVESFVEQVCATHGVPDVVVNNAGIGHGGKFLDTPPEQFDRVLDVNFGGVVNCCRSFARRLVERGTGGHIVNVASMAAYSPAQAMSAYATSKAAVFMFSDCLRAELASAGIGLTTICPGVIDTNIIDTIRFDVPAEERGNVEQVRAQTKKFFAARRYGPEKVAKAIVAAVRKDKAIRPVTPEAYAAYGVARLMPSALRRVARSTSL